MPMRFRSAAAVWFCFALSAPQLAQAVNLVPNDSFENYLSCPASFSQMYQAAPWDAPTTGTSDYYNACASGPNLPDVPTNNFGFQNARTGNGYAGFIVYSGAPDYREYIEAPLNAPLVASNTYVVKFYVSLSDNADTAIDRIGAFLSAGPVGPIGNWNPLPFVPQVESPPGGYLTDKVNWVLITGTLVAAGGEDHIVIGNFHDDAGTAITPMAGNWPGSNYFIDDVSVELQPAAVDQACCASDGTCSLATPTECQAQGGTPLAATSCFPNPCGPTATRKTSWGTLKLIYR